MPTRDQVLERLDRFDGDYDAVARSLGVWPGQAYLIATGLPADGGDTFPPGELHRLGALPTSTQHLVSRHSPPENPTTKPHVHRWVRRLAEADLPMRRAAQARDAAPGEVTEPDETDVATVVTRAHDQITALLKQLKTVPGVTAGGDAVHQSRRRSIADMVSEALSRHEAAEQQHLWPAVGPALPDGDQVAATALEQERRGKDLLTAIGRTDPADERFDQLAVELDDAARSHVAYEDRVLLRLRTALSDDDRRQLGAAIRTAQAHGPTRPHPDPPERPAAAVKAAGAAAAAADRVRDATGNRPASRRGKAEQETRSAGAGEAAPAAGPQLHQPPTKEEDG